MLSAKQAIAILLTTLVMFACICLIILLEYWQWTEFRHRQNITSYESAPPYRFRIGYARR